MKKNRFLPNNNHNASAIIMGSLALIIFLGIIILGPMVFPNNAETMSIDAILAPPSITHWAGTDQLGRDIFIRTLVGARSTLGIALFGTILGVGSGALIGMTAGYKRGQIDNILMRLCDALMALPSIILAMLVVIVIGSGSFAILLAIIGIFTPRSARIIRSATLNVATQEFVSAASVVGERQYSIIFREIMPNILPNILVEACLRFSYAILVISALGYLGIGVQPPVPDWGLMIADGGNYISIAPWMIFTPAAGIVISVIIVNLLGDILQDSIGDRQNRMAEYV